MRSRRHQSRTIRPLVAIAAAASLAAAMTPSSGGAAAPPSASSSSAAKPDKAATEKVSDYDARRGASTRALQNRDARIAANPTAGVRTLRRQAGQPGHRAGRSTR